VSVVPYLVVAGCEAGDTVCIGTTGDSGEPTAEGLYLYLKSVFMYTLK